MIIEFMGKEITKMSLLPSIVAQTPVGTKAELSIIRKGKKKKLTIKIAKLDEEKVAGGTTPGESTSRKLGLTVQELTPEIAQSMGLEDEKGLLIANVESGSPAATAGLKRGEIIIEVNQQTVESIKDFNKILGKIKPNESILLLTKKDGHTRFIVVKNK